MSRHKILKRIFVWGIEWTCLLPVIADNCKQLEKLNFTMSGRITTPTGTVGTAEHEKALKSLQTLKNLKELKMKCFLPSDLYKIIQTTKSLHSLECIELITANINCKLLLALSLLEKLYILRLIGCHNINNLIELGRLDQLTELKIKSFYHSNRDFEFDDLVDIIKHLNNLKKLNVDEVRIDKNIYLRIVNVVRGRRQPPHTLEFRCPNVNDDVKDLQFVGDHRYIVKLV